jgi:hypothetical protein
VRRRGVGARAVQGHADAVCLSGNAARRVEGEVRFVEAVALGSSAASTAVGRRRAARVTSARWARSRR